MKYTKPLSLSLMIAMALPSIAFATPNNLPNAYKPCNRNHSVESCSKSKIVDNSTTTTRSKSDATAKSNASGGDARASGGSVGDINIGGTRGGGDGGDRSDRVPDVALSAYTNSFSYAYCMGTAQGSVTVPGFGLGGGKPVADQNCMRVIRSQEFSNKAKATSDADMAAKLQSMAVFELCAADVKTGEECAKKGLTK